MEVGPEIANVRVTVQARAARDATRRAEEYAEAFGGRLGELIEAADTGLLGGQAVSWRAAAAPAPMPGGAMRSRGGPVPDAPALDLEPVTQSVTAHVDARFTMVLLKAPAAAREQPPA